MRRFVIEGGSLSDVGLEARKLELGNNSVVHGTRLRCSVVGIPRLFRYLHSVCNLQLQGIQVKYRNMCTIGPSVLASFIFEWSTTYHRSQKAKSKQPSRCRVEDPDIASASTRIAYKSVVSGARIINAVQNQEEGMVLFPAHTPRVEALCGGSPDELPNRVIPKNIWLATTSVDQTNETGHAGKRTTC
jgi:hypothetical protein